jgi:hypothetical protein
MSGQCEIRRSDACDDVGASNEEGGEDQRPVADSVLDAWSGIFKPMLDCNSCHIFIPGGQLRAANRHNGVQTVKFQSGTPALARFDGLTGLSAP